MAYTQADLDALNSAIGRDELEVEHNGTRTRYRSIAELKAAYEHVKGELAAQQAASTGGRRATFQYSFTTLRGE